MWIWHNMNRTQKSFCPILIILCCLSCSIFAQVSISEANDNLKNGKTALAISQFEQIIETFKDDENPNLDSLISAYEGLQYCYTVRFKLDSSIIVLKQAEDYFQSIGDDTRFLEFTVPRAEMYYLMSKFDEAKDIYFEALNNNNLSRDNRKRASLRVANIFMGKANKEKAYEYINIALDIAIEDNDTSLLGNIYEGYASIEMYFGNKNKALDHYINAIPYLKGQNKSMILSSTLRRIGNIFEELNNLDKAKDYVKKAMDVAKEYNLKKEIASCLNISGRIAKREGNCEKAIELFEESLPHFLNSRIVNNALSTISDIALCHLNLGNIKDAEKSLAQADDLLPKATVLNHIIAYHYTKFKFYIIKNNKEKATFHLNECRLISDGELGPRNVLTFLLMDKMYHEKFQNYKEALRASNRYYIFRDSINNLRQSEMVFDLEAQYKKKEQDKEIALLNNENKLKAERLSKQKITIVGGGLALLLFSLLSIFVYRLYKRVQVQNNLIKSSLNEKDTLLREIHHRVKNNLQVISSLLALQSKYVQDPIALAALKQGQERVHSMALIHQDLYENQDMSGVNTYNYLEQLCENLFDSYNIDEENISYNLMVEEMILDVDTMIPLGLILNELVSNALKHAFKDDQRGKIDIVLKEINNQIHLEISDNGSGVNDLSDIEGKSFGYELIKAFSKKLNAEMVINSENGLKIKLLISNYKKAA